MIATPRAFLRGGDQLTLTQSASQTVTPLNSIACYNQGLAATAENSVWRVFDLSASGLTADFDVTEVSFGIETVTLPAPFATSVRLYTLEGAFVLANLTLVGESTLTLTGSEDGTVVTVPVSGTFDATDQLVVEWHVPDLRTTGGSVFYGSNGAGESAPTYLSSTTCGIAQPTTLMAVGGFDDVHWVLNVTGTTDGGLVLPALSLNPTEINATVAAGGTTTATVTIGNTGTADLDFSFPAFAATARLNQLTAFGFDVNRQQAVIDMLLGKGVEGSGQPNGNASEFRVGGPDAYGYTFIDSNEPGGPVANFQDISTTGTLVTLEDIPGCQFDGTDEGRAAIELPAPFSFYGEDYSTAYVYANGFIGFDPSFNACSYTNSSTMPNSAAPNGGIIAPFWDDLDLTAQGDVYSQEMPNGDVIIQWNDVNRVSGTNSLTFQVVLSPSGAIRIEYGTMTGTLNSATTGIENQAGTQGLLVNANAAGYIASGLAIAFTPPTLFIADVEPPSGTVTAGGSTTVTVTMSAEGLEEGTYTQDLTLSTNDPDQTSVTIPVTLTVTGPPPVTVTPSPVVESLESGETGTETVTITNSTDEAVTYSFPQYASDARTPAPRRTVHQAVDLAKGATDTRSGTQAAYKDAGGPDAFGYEWIDSNEPGGPAYDWIDISGTGTLLTLDATPGCSFDGPDEGRANVAFPTPFSFYGTDYASVNVYANGVLILDAADTGCTFTNAAIPTAARPNAIIAPFWDDLDLTDSGDVYSQVMPDGSVIIQFEEASRFFSSVDFYTFQVILSPSGAIKFQYESMVGITNSATVGIEDPTGTDGLQVAFNQAYVEDGLAVLIQARPSFLTAIDPPSGTIPANSSVTVEFEFDATGLFAGAYEGEVDLVTSVDTLSVPVVLNVTGMPTVTITPSPVTFGDVIVGNSATSEVTIVNNGTSDLTISSITSSSGVFTVEDDLPITIAPGQSETVTVTFTPTTPGAVTATLSVVSNASSSPDTVTLSGNALAPPDFSVSPSSLQVTIGESEAPVTRSLTLSNTGAGAGTFTAEAVVLGDFVPAPEESARTRGTDLPQARRGQGMLRTDGSSEARASVSLGGYPQTVFHRGGDVTITQSASQTVTALNSIACYNQGLAATAENSVWRVFDLSEYALSGGLDVSEVSFGIETSNVPAPFDTSVRLYRLEGDFSLANLTLVGESTLTLTGAETGMVVSVPVSGAFGATDHLVVEWHVPDLRDIGGSVFYGSNAAGESGPTYLSSTTCAFPEPTTLSEIGFNDVHWVLNVTGTSGEPLVSVSPESGTVAAGGTQMLTVTINTADTEVGSYEAEIRISTNEPGADDLVVPVSVNVVVAGEDNGQIPTEVVLLPGYPNPVATTATLKFGLPEAGPVRLHVYDVSGRLVATVVDGERAAGYHEVSWNAHSLASGLYFVRMQAGAEMRTVRVSVVR